MRAVLAVLTFAFALPAAPREEAPAMRWRVTGDRVEEIRDGTSGLLVEVEPGLERWGQELLIRRLNREPQLRGVDVAPDASWRASLVVARALATTGRPPLPGTEHTTLRQLDWRPPEPLVPTICGTSIHAGAPRARAVFDLRQGRGEITSVFGPVVCSIPPSRPHGAVQKAPAGPVEVVAWGERPYAEVRAAIARLRSAEPGRPIELGPTAQEDAEWCALR